MNYIPHSLNDLRSITEKHGSHWFDHGTMSFFNSRLWDAFQIGPDTYRFITSERFDDDHPDLYTVRHMSVTDEHGVRVTDVGGFQRYASLADAQAHLTDPLDGENLTLQERYEDALETILDLRLTVDTLNEELIHAQNEED